MSKTTLQLGKRRFIIIGTAHISEQSILDVKDGIEEHSPDCICVEIDRDRYKNLVNANHWKSTNIATIIRERKALFMLTSLVLSAFQRRLGVNQRPGEEMLVAIQEAEAKDIRYAMIDRKVNITLLRAWRKANFFQKNKLLAVLFALIFENKKIDQEEIEKLREDAEIGYMIQELAKLLPSAKRILIDERDQYLAHNLYHANGDSVLAVVGAGHVQGMVECMTAIHNKSQEVDIQELETIPPPSVLSRVLPWAVPAIVLFLIGRGFFLDDWATAANNVWQWILINGSLAAAGSLIVLAHPLTIIATFIAAPLTSLNPTIGVGFVSGILESVFRPPRVADFESIYSDISKIRGWFRNRITHTLLVFLFSSIGSAIGTFIALPFLFS